MSGSNKKMQKRHWTNGDIETEKAERTEIQPKWRKSIQHIVATWTLLSIVSESLYFFFLLFSTFILIYITVTNVKCFSTIKPTISMESLSFSVFFFFISIWKKKTRLEHVNKSKSIQSDIVFSATLTHYNWQWLRRATVILLWFIDFFEYIQLTGVFGRDLHRCVRDNCSILVFKK